MLKEVVECAAAATRVDAGPAAALRKVVERRCRFCREPLEAVVADLGMTPLANSYVEPDRLHAMEPFYPLCAYLCDRCLLVQLEEFRSPSDIFCDYAYFSSYSDSWLRHAASYVAMAMERFGLGPESTVVEVASNDGYLLQYFAARRVPVLGIEPAANVAAAAMARGIPTRVDFFGARLGQLLRREGLEADLIVGNNVLAHVPDVNDFVSGLASLLRPAGTITLEFPHLARLIDGNQFDTIYHEHFSYFSLLSASRIVAHHGLTVFDVEELGTHGGSLRIYVRHADDASRPVSRAVADLLDREAAAGMSSRPYYAAFAERVREAKRALLEFLIAARRDGKSIAAYGAPAKANTLLNYCGVGRDFIDYTVDRSPHKQGRYLPGTHLPIRHPDEIARTRPDYLLILPWNLSGEIVTQMAHIRSWGGRFVLPIPDVRVLDGVPA
jgi:2-polyprenyl-3-methyl-5-hydroxy-6-metoxy-1,4-benzoquinol methylase